MLNELLADATAGDPMGHLRWTHKTTRKLALELRRRGFCVGHVTVGRLLREQRYSLRANSKRLAGKQHPDRDRQFRLLARRRRQFLKSGWPVISVATKKKELIGNFKNAGRTWRRLRRDVQDHDFPSLATGRAIPYGIYDEGRNAGYVVVGTTHDTAAFAIASIRSWWLKVGRHSYPAAPRLMIEADGGGSNGSRNWGWKVGLQQLANEFRLTITVGHYPPGASKWNPIEHRMFGLISENWAGEPLVSYELVLKHIRSTRSNTGFHCRACSDRTHYATKVKVTREEQTGLRLTRHRILPKWNYTIRPKQANTRSCQNG